jgi:hypothetical protein
MLAIASLAGSPFIDMILLQTLVNRSELLV